MTLAARLAALATAVRDKINEMMPRLIPAGGASGQVLAKTSGSDYAVGWSTPSGGAVAWVDVTGKPTFATVSTTGAYSDLSDLPTLFSGAYADLTGKPTLFDGAYASLTGKPTLGTAAAAATGDFAAASHTHAAANITDFAAAVAATSAVAANSSKVTNATHTGDVTGSTALTIAAGAVSFAKMANVATLTVFGRVAASTGVAKALTAAELTTIPNVFTRALKGLVPPSGGTSAITAFLCEDGTFRIPNAPRSDPTGITGADAVSNIVSLTTAEYAAIGSPNASTLYLITDAT
jgi:hypothetical protein